MKVLFVCSGNICRSPMAAEYLRHRAAHGGLAHLVVDSAGTLGIEGAPASPEAVAVLREDGLDLSGHRSRGVRPPDLRTADIVVAMSVDHLDALAHLFRGEGQERYLLRSFEEGPEPRVGAPDLEDPIGAPLETYRREYLRIKACVDHLVLFLRHAAP